MTLNGHSDQLNKVATFLCGFTTLCSACASPKGTFVDSLEYVPPIGSVICELPGGRQYAKIDEMYSETVGGVIFSDSGFWYRLDIQEAPLPFEPTDSQLENLLNSYLLESTVPYFENNEMPGGILEKHYAISPKGMTAYYGLFRYPDGIRGRGVFPRNSEPLYVGTVIYWVDGFYYSVTSSMPIYAFSKDHSVVDRGDIVDSVVRDFLRCEFGPHVHEIVELGTRYPVPDFPRILVVKIQTNDNLFDEPVLSVEYSESRAQRTDLDYTQRKNKSMAPALFLTIASNRNAQILMLRRTDAEYHECFVAINNSLGTTGWIEGADYDLIAAKYANSTVESACVLRNDP